MNTHHQYCKNKVIKSGSSFYYSFLFLPQDQRQAIIAVYAFCREVDDVVDNCKDIDVARKKLAWWQEEIERVFNGQPNHPVGRALIDVLAMYPLQKVWFDEILQGMQMDLQYHGYQTFADLKVYCHCVASAVGMISAEIFGYTDPKTMEYARLLGIAFQLVNIIRDVGEDARRGRIYLPEEELNKFNISAEELLGLEVKSKAGFLQLMQFQAQRARDYYHQALAALPAGDRYAQRSGLIMAKIYFTILDEIEKSNFNIINQRISITPVRKLWIAWRTARNEKNMLRTTACPTS